MKKYKIFSLLFSLLVATQIEAQDISGSWNGTLSVMGTELDMTYNIYEDGSAFKATLDVPLQGVTGFELDNVSLNNNELTIRSSKLQMTYKGKLEGEIVTGTYSQMGQDFPLTLERTILEKPGKVDLVTSQLRLQEIADMEKGSYKYTVRDIFRKPEASSFKLSPDGTYLSYKEKDAEGKNHVYVKNTKTGEVNRAIEEKERLVLAYLWANGNRLLYLMDDGGNENYHLYGVDIDGKNQQDLTPYENITVNRFYSTLKEEKDYIIIAMNKDNPAIHEPYKININNGELEKLFTNEDAFNPIIDYNFDKTGFLKSYSKLVGGVNQQYFYRENKESDFEKKIDISVLESSFGIQMFDYSTDYPHDAIVISNMNSDKTEVHRFDCMKGEMIELLYKNNEFDVSGASISRNRDYTIDYFAYNGEKSVITPVSDHYKSLIKKFEKQFGNYSVNVVDETDDESKLLLFVSSDKVYGRYYLYNDKNSSFEFLFDLLPHLQEEDMGEMLPIKFQSRDKKTVYGYLTLPSTYKSGDKLPLIVIPHGGPHGVRDNWTFLQENQLFASRGYATLQVNFRGSGGYGKAFLADGYHQVGRGMMDDVEDGVQYVIEQGFVDPNRMAIFGASHGGYASLMGLVKTPELFTCAVDYVGVSNLFTFMETFPPYWKPFEAILKNWWYDKDNAEDAEIMKEISPVFHVDKIKKPLFVVQGANDPRVNINEADQIVEALREKGFEVPYMVKYDEGHGFAREENRIELYETMMGFFAEHMKNNN